jgi:hypothetical protein
MKDMVITKKSSAISAVYKKSIGPVSTKCQSALPGVAVGLQSTTFYLGVLSGSIGSPQTALLAQWV